MEIELYENLVTTGYGVLSLTAAGCAVAVAMHGWLRRRKEREERERLRRIAIAVPETVALARAKFTQWPPAPGEVSPGEGGGVSPGVTEEQIGTLVELWRVIHKIQPTAPSPVFAMRGYFNTRYGWMVADIKDIDPDQFYTARMVLREWLETGKEPTPTPKPTVNANRAADEQQRDVGRVNRPWTPPEQPQPQPKGNQDESVETVGERVRLEQIERLTEFKNSTAGGEWGQIQILAQIAGDIDRGVKGPRIETRDTPDV